MAVTKPTNEQKTEVLDDMFRIIIAGGRDFSDYNLLSTTMDYLLSRVNDEIIVVCGKARGADTLGELYGAILSSRLGAVR